VKVEVLYVAACPYHPKAVRLVREVLAAEGLDTDVYEVLVADERMAGELRFLGSPSIRINGQDVDRESQSPQSFGLSCRLYAGSKVVGLPPAEVIHQAVVEAHRGRMR
jgi:hypothetical protein